MRKLIITLNRDVLLLTLILQCHLIQYILELMEILSFRYKNRERKKRKARINTLFNIVGEHKFILNNSNKHVSAKRNN